MAARRTTYLVLLAAATALHLVYGQYLTHYMVIFLLCVPVLSLLVSIPSAVGASVTLQGGSDVCRGRETRVLLTLDSGASFPPAAWSVTLVSRNVFTGRVDSKQKIRIFGERQSERAFSPDTSQIGCVRYKIKRAFIFEHLGLIPIPVKKGGSVSIRVLPDIEKPFPEPDLVMDSARALRPKPQGFSEEHELRPYHDGDPLNLVHWKLSSKNDELILREPQEVIRRDIFIIADLPDSYPDHRSVLEQICYLNGVLAESEIPYKLQYGRRTYNINSQNDYDEFIGIVLSEHMRFENALIPEMPKDALAYRVRPRKGGVL